MKSVTVTSVSGVGVFTATCSCADLVCVTVNLLHRVVVCHTVSTFFCLSVHCSSVPISVSVRVVGAAILYSVTRH